MRQIGRLDKKVQIQKLIDSDAVMTISGSTSDIFDGTYHQDKTVNVLPHPDSTFDLLRSHGVWYGPGGTHFFPVYRTTASPDALNGYSWRGISNAGFMYHFTGVDTSELLPTNPSYSTDSLAGSTITLQGSEAIVTDSKDQTITSTTSNPSGRGAFGQSYFGSGSVVQASSEATVATATSFTSWVTIHDLFAQIRFNLKGTENESNFIEQSEQIVEVFTRFVKGVTAKDRIQYIQPDFGTRYFDIIQVVTNGRNESLQLRCKEVQI